MLCKNSLAILLANAHLDSVDWVVLFDLLF